jgi:hypothetical protein
MQKYRSLTGRKQIFIHVLAQVYLFLKANSLKVFEIFFGLTANVECTHTISFAITLLVQHSKYKLYQNFITTQPSILKIQNSQLFFSATYIHFLLPLKVSSSFLKSVPSLHHIFTSRINRYCQETFIPVNPPFYLSVTSAVPLNTPTKPSSVLRLVVTVYRYP